MSSEKYLSSSSLRITIKRNARQVLSALWCFKAPGQTSTDLLTSLGIAVRCDKARSPATTAIALFVLCGVFSNFSRAGEVPGFDKPVSLQAVEQSVPVFVESLFSQIGVPVRVESSIPGTVNGAFRGTAEQIFAQISQAFNVYMYYDSSVAYVYPSDQMNSVILPLTHSAAKRVATSAKNMGFSDQRNYVTAIEGGGLMINGSARFIEQIESLSKASREEVRSIPAKKSPLEFRLFRLKYAWADDVELNVGGSSVKVPGVATLLRTLILDDGSLPLASGVSVRRDAQSLVKLKGTGLNAQPTEDAVEDTPAPLIRKSDGVQFSIVAQPQLNAVAIRDTADRMPLYEQLIASLDVEPEMVEIEATIIDINVDRTRELGVNWRLQGSDAEFLVGEGTASDRLLQPGQIITPQGEGGILSLVLGDSTQFFARVKALEREGAAHVVSKPHVLTLSNVEAVLGSTTEFFVRVEGNEEVDLFKVPVGTVLRVTPHVYTEGGSTSIKLLVNIEDGSAIPGSVVDDIPVVERSVISTQALIKEGASLLIGGLVRESAGDSEVRVPALGKLPVVGGLFRSRQSNKIKTERLFMITPRTTNNNQKNLNQKGPVLQGDPIDIISSSNRLIGGEKSAINGKVDQLASALKDPVPAPVPETPLGNEEITLSLLHVPAAPTDEQVQLSEVVQRWAEVADTSGDIVAFEEIPANRNRAAPIQTNSKPDVATFAASEDVAVANASTLPANNEFVAEVAALPEVPEEQLVAKVEAPAAAALPDSFSAKPLQSQINELTTAIAWDLKARDADRALEKIYRLKKLDPTHDYAVNGEIYVALMRDSLEQSPNDL